MQKSLKKPVKKSHILGAFALAAIAVTAVPATAQAAQLSGQVTGLGGKCLDVRSGSTGNGTPVQLYSCNGTDSQKWTYTEQPGEVGATVTAFGKCLDVASSGTTDGTKVQLWDCNGSGAQKWVRYLGDTLVNPQSGKCLDVPGGNTVDGNALQIYTCNGTDSQKWTFGGTSTPQPGDRVEQFKREVFDRVNAYRQQNGKQPLQWDNVLARTAQDEADEQARRQRQGHYTFENIYDRMRQYGYSHPLGGVWENAAGARGFWKDPQSVVQAWIDEPGHRANILTDSKWSGVGLTVDGNGNYWWAQDFAG
ncbi:CAP domain-containing protein [Streptomyces gamaensis]|uniref:CAP domain-containing protein n=1 Tax=Streptomyces gamaensis TaxID=1763542 RepID=A0ABW0Z0Q4_9ACTN